MPAQPLPAEGAGQGRVVFYDQRHQLRAVMYRQAATGAWVQVGEFFVSYPQVQEMLSRLEGTPGPDELGWVSSVDELGAFGDRIKRAAKKVAHSKALKAIKQVAKIAAPIAAAVVPGGQALAAAGAAAMVAKAAAKKVKQAKALKSAKQALTRGSPPAVTRGSPQPQRRALASVTAPPTRSKIVAPKLGQSLRALEAQGGTPATLQQARAIEAKKVLDATPPEQRPEVAAKIEQRLDAYKVLAPNGDVIWVPLDELS